MVNRIVLVASLFVLPALVPMASLERSRYLIQLSIAPAPAQLAVPVAGVSAAKLRSS